MQGGEQQLVPALGLNAVNLTLLHFVIVTTDAHILVSDIFTPFLLICVSQLSQAVTVWFGPQERKQMHDLFKLQRRTSERNVSALHPQEPKVKFSEEWR